MNPDLRPFQGTEKTEHHHLLQRFPHEVPAFAHKRALQPDKEDKDTYSIQSCTGLNKYTTKYKDPIWLYQHG